LSASGQLFAGSCAENLVEEVLVVQFSVGIHLLVLHDDNGQSFGFGDLRLAFVSGEENLAFQFKGESDVKQIKTPGTHGFGVLLREGAGAMDGTVPVGSDFHQKISIQHAPDARKGFVAFAAHVAALAGGQRPAEVKCFQAGGVFCFQSMKRQIKQPRAL
jgi:hypothetical protein